MPLLDKELLLSDNQETTSTEISDNVVNLKTIAAAQQLGFVWVNCVCSVTFDSSGTIQVCLMHDGDEAVGDGVEFMKSQVFQQPTAGDVLMSICVPLAALDQFVGLEYTIGSFGSTGSVDAWVGLHPVSSPLNVQASMPTPAPADPPAIT